MRNLALRAKPMRRTTFQMNYATHTDNCRKNDKEKYEGDIAEPSIVVA
jgi:hypothetical protein